MERLRVSPTKSNLLRIREELAFAREGKDLLSQKREVLVMELMRLQDDAQKAREELDELLARGYRAFAEATVQNGFDGMARLALASPELPEVKIHERGVMGVVVPIVEKPKVEWHVRYGLAAAPLAADRAGRIIYEAIARLLEVAEIETAIYRLAAETRKTLRRERALENLFIPQYQKTVKFIQESLEEKERENFYQLKLLKGKGRP
jgi:V/A-type H+-transporting ATPase subunit D